MNLVLSTLTTVQYVSHGMTRLMRQLPFAILHHPCGGSLVLWAAQLAVQFAVSCRLGSRCVVGVGSVVALLRCGAGSYITLRPVRMSNDESVVVVSTLVS